MSLPANSEEWQERVKLRMHQRRDAAQRAMVRRYDRIMRDIRRNNIMFNCPHARPTTLDTEPEDINGLAIDSIRVKKCLDCKRLLEIVV